VHWGASLHGSPARYDANSMKHAPVFGDRCRPRESCGIPSGVLLGSIPVPLPFGSAGEVQGDPADAVCRDSPPDRRERQGGP